MPSALQLEAFEWEGAACPQSDPTFLSATLRLALAVSSVGKEDAELCAGLDLEEVGDDETLHADQGVETDEDRMYNAKLNFLSLT